MSLKTEQEIMKKWKYMDPPLVSVCCITYNHEPYIRDAIEGFLMQETEFPFEVIIHDDASTDRTAEIVRDYAERYPQIIRPIYQTENQYSKGVRMSATYVWPRATGEYIALCEGDDYWTDPQKLQLQKNALESNLECDLCIHYGEVIGFKEKTNLERGFRNTDNSNEIMYLVDASGVIEGNLGPQFSLSLFTASFFLRKSLIDGLPSWFYSKTPIGDYYIAIFGALRGGLLVYPRAMSVYRMNHPTSWSSQMNKTPEARLVFNKKMVESLDLFNEHTSHVYEESIRLKIAKITQRDGVKLLLANNHEKFKVFIESSVEYYPGLSVLQSLTYFFRSLPGVVRACYSFANFVLTLAGRKPYV